MANNPNEGSTDDFLEQILGIPNFVGSSESGLTASDGSLAVGSPMMLQLSSGDGTGHISALGGGVNGGFHGQMFPLGLSLEQGSGGFLKPEEVSGSGRRFTEEHTVKNVLSMSRLGGAGAVAPLVTDIPLSSVEDESGGGERGRNQPAWEKWSNDGTESQVAKLMEENVGAAMQFLQSKALCIMPMSLATAIYHSQSPESSNLVKPETNPPS